MDLLLAAFGEVLQPWPLVLMLLGTVIGIAVGCIPGLNGATVIALCLPLTFFMAPLEGMVLLIALYASSTAGGLISATLMRMPGTPNQLMTVLDGYPMAQSGQAGRALGLGIVASTIGGLIGWVLLATLSPPLAEIGVRFGPYEIFSMVIIALVLIAAVSGKSLIRGLIAAVLGAMAAMVGSDPASGSLRLTFDLRVFEAGFKLLPVLLGVMVVAQVLDDLATLADRPLSRHTHASQRLWLRLSDLARHKWGLLRGSLIGTWIGVLPGIGTTTAAIASYAIARVTSRTPEQFGKGSEEGIVAAESANNAAVCGALVPMIALGIPGSVVDVILIGALIMQGIVPGPLLFDQQPQLVWGIIAAALIAQIAMFAIMMLTTPLFERLMHVPKAWLLPPIVIFCVLGALADGNRLADVWVMIGFGVFGWLMTRCRLPIGPFIIGFILAPIAETNMRSGLMIYDGSALPLLTRPISALFLAVALATLVWSVWQETRAHRPRPALSPSGQRP